MTVRENLDLGAYTRNRQMAQVKLDMDRVFDQFPRLKEREAQSAGTLSGGRTTDACNRQSINGAAPTADAG